MSVYQFAPPPDLSTRETNFATWENSLSESEIARIRVLGDAMAKTEAVTGAGLVPELRKSQVAWLGLSPDTDWLYDKLAFAARQLNGQFFGFDLFGFVEDFQYTMYGPTGDRYGLHMDKGQLNCPPRKLSLTVQLSTPDEYEGGDLMFHVEEKPVRAERTQGLIYAFPSYVMHEVTPVTRGTRRSLVVWMCGNKFR